METFLYTVIPALYQFEGGPEAQVGDQVKLYLDTEAQPGFPEFITGVIQHPIVRVCDGTRYAVEYDPADLDGAAELLVTGDVLSALVVSAVDLLRDYVDDTFALKTTTINGQPLSANVTLDNEDVGAAAASHDHDSRYHTKTESTPGDTAPVNAVAAVAATGYLQFSGDLSVVSDGFSVGGVSYSYISSGPAGSGQIVTDGVLVAFGGGLLDAIVSAVNSGVGGGSANPLVTASNDGVNKVTFTAKTTGTSGNSIALSESHSQSSVSGSTLTGGVTAVAATSAPPYIRVHGGYLYIQEAGVWKKAALSTL